MLYCTGHGAKVSEETWGRQKGNAWAILVAPNASLHPDQRSLNQWTEVSVFCFRVEVSCRPLWPGNSNLSVSTTSQMLGLQASSWRIVMRGLCCVGDWICACWACILPAELPLQQDQSVQWNTSMSVSYPSLKFNNYLFSTYYLPSKLSHTSQLPSGHSVASYLSKHGLIVHPKITTQVYTTNIESPSPCWVLF